MRFDTATVERLQKAADRNLPADRAAVFLLPALFADSNRDRPEFPAAVMAAYRRLRASPTQTNLR
jgi:hypothetical protein